MPRTLPLPSSSISTGLRQPVELDAFLLGVMHFLGARRRFGFASADRCSRPSRRRAAAIRASRPSPCCRRRPPRRACRAAAACRSRKVACAHQVAARQQLVRREHAVERLAGDAEHRRIARAGADEDGVEAQLVDHLLDGEEPPDQRVALELARRACAACRSRRRSPRWAAGSRDAVLQHAARLVERLVDGDVAAGLRHVGGAGHARRDPSRRCRP